MPTGDSEKSFDSPRDANRLSSGGVTQPQM